MSILRRFRPIAVAGLMMLLHVAAYGQAYTSIVVFGDSLCDTGNDAQISAGLYTVNAQVPGPATGYTNGRFTDGPDTSPAARSYTGVWLEQLATRLAAVPSVQNSLAGGNNYAYGFATTGTGTSSFTYGPGNALAFNVQNMQLQLSTYLATKPTITNKTLFVVWGGANDLIQATAGTAAQVASQAAQNDAAIVQQLINAGATDFLVVNLPPLGLVPLNNGSTATSVPATQLAGAFNQYLAAYVGAIPAANAGKTLNIRQMDTYTLFNTIVGPPFYKGFANVTAMSQGNTAINPDTYLFWDDLHPTTYGHSILAATALTAIGPPVTTTSAVASSNLNANLSSSVTLTATVNASAGQPMGYVTFMDGMTALNNALVLPSSTVATASTATYTTTSLAAGSHSITAVFAGVNGYSGASSSAVTEIVTAPALLASFPVSTLSIPSGSAGTATLSLTPVGGFSGVAALACGALPNHFTCNIGPTSISFPGGATSAAVYVGTSGSVAQLEQMPLAERLGQHASAAFLLFPGVGFFALLAGRRRRLPKLMVALMAVLALGAVAGVSGCGGGSNNNAMAGTYTIPVVVSANSTTSTVNLSVTVY